VGAAAGEGWWGLIHWYYREDIHVLLVDGHLGRNGQSHIPVCSRCSAHRFRIICCSHLPADSARLPAGDSVILDLAPTRVFLYPLLLLGRGKLGELLKGQSTLTAQVADTGPVGGYLADFGGVGIGFRPNVEYVVPGNP